MDLFLLLLLLLPVLSAILFTPPCVFNHKEHRPIYIYIHISIWNKQHFSHCRSYSITAVYCLNTPHWVGVYLWNTRIRHPNSWDSLDIIWSIPISSIARLSQHTNTRHKDHTNQISQRQLSKRLCFECSFVVKCMLSGFILEIRASRWVPFLGNY